MFINYSRASIIWTSFIQKIVYPKLKSENRNFDHLSEIRKSREKKQNIFLKTLISYTNLGLISCNQLRYRRYNNVLHT